MKLKERKLFAEAVETFGINHQLTKAIEEFSELQVELARAVNGKARRNLLLEVVDAQIMLDQLILIFFNEAGEEANTYEKLRASQLRRLRGKLKTS